ACHDRTRYDRATVTRPRNSSTDRDRRLTWPEQAHMSWDQAPSHLVRRDPSRRYPAKSRLAPSHGTQTKKTTHPYYAVTSSREQWRLLPRSRRPYTRTYPPKES